MAFDFSRERDEDDPRAREADGPRPVKPAGAEVYEFGEPNQPPAGLMRKRAHVFLWIALALALGLLMAGAMVLIES